MDEADCVPWDATLIWARGEWRLYDAATSARAIIETADSLGEDMDAIIRAIYWRPHRYESATVTMIACDEGDSELWHYCQEAPRTAWAMGFDANGRRHYHTR